MKVKLKETYKVALFVLLVFTTPGCAVSPDFGEMDLRNFNDDFQKNLPTNPQYKVEKLGDNSFYLTLHQGEILISEGSTRAYYLGIAGEVVAREMCAMEKKYLKKLELHKDGDKSWVHVVGKFVCISSKSTTSPLIIVPKLKESI